MTLQPLGLLLTAALVIAVRLADAWVHRRRVASRLRGLRRSHTILASTSLTFVQAKAIREWLHS